MIIVPRGFVQIEQGPLTLVLHQDYCERLLQCGIGDPERLCAQQTGRMHAGRGAMPVIELDSSSERIVVRKYRRGGLLRFLNTDIFLGPQRPFNELAVTLRAAQAGIPVADIVGALSLRVYGPLYRHYLVSRELINCCDLPTWFQESTGADEDSVALASNVADCIRHMHDSGFYHGDLNLKNILVSRADVRQLFIIDWDKSTHTQGALGLMSASAMLSGSAARPGNYACAVFVYPSSFQTFSLSITGMIRPLRISAGRPCVGR